MNKQNLKKATRKREIIRIKVKLLKQKNSTIKLLKCEFIPRFFLNDRGSSGEGRTMLDLIQEI